jgi:hypothetical protein
MIALYTILSAIAITNFESENNMSDIFKEMSIDLEVVAESLIWYGAFVVLLSILGFASSCLVKLSKYYILAIIINMSAIVCIWSFAIDSIMTKKRVWDSMTTQDWSSKNETVQDFIQYSFLCCGFNSSDSAYRGGSLVVGNLTNHCATIAGNTTLISYPTCLDEGVLYLNQTLTLIIWLGSAAFLVSAISIFASNYCKEELKKEEERFKV